VKGGAFLSRGAGTGRSPQMPPQARDEPDSPWVYVTKQVPLVSLTASGFQFFDLVYSEQPGPTCRDATQGHRGTCQQSCHTHRANISSQPACRISVTCLVPKRDIFLNAVYLKSLEPATGLTSYGAARRDILTAINHTSVPVVCYAILYCDLSKTIILITQVTAFAARSQPGHSQVAAVTAMSQPGHSELLAYPRCRVTRVTCESGFVDCVCKSASISETCL